LRVSTARQSRSGLGLEAQRQAVEAFAAAHGFTIAAELVEVETGKGSDALSAGRSLPPPWSPPGSSARARRCSSPSSTAVARRGVHRRADGAEGAVRGRRAGADADPFMLHLYAALAEKERALISVRTKAALQAAKERFPEPW
jgi:DNA invertase Pin-like site-specific DNA recombinase